MSFLRSLLGKKASEVNSQSGRPTQLTDSERFKRMVAENDEKILKDGLRPHYMVTDGGKWAFPCVSRELAEGLCLHLKSQGVDTRIIDLTDYDWERNPLELNLARMR